MLLIISAAHCGAPGFASNVPAAAGAGDRLGLVCEETGDPLPAALLPYCGRPIFQGLLRDLTAREFLFFRTFGQQLRTPVAIMTSDAKGNHARVSAMLEESSYFGRPKSSFTLFNQPLVPVLEVETGQWVLPEALRPSMKPGGHGAIWKLMHDHGIFHWLESQGASRMCHRRDLSHRSPVLSLTATRARKPRGSAHRMPLFSSPPAGPRPVRLRVPCVGVCCSFCTRIVA